MLNNPIKRPRVLSVFSLVMINVIAVDSLRTLPFSAEYGFSLVFYYLLAAIVFFVPTAIVSAELATGWPAIGGLYVWVREAFGKRWGFFTIWLQWIYNVVWYPTILAFMASALAMLIDPNLKNDKTFLLAVILILFWGATFINFFGMRVSGWFSTFGALVGTIIPMMFIIGLGVVWVVSGRHEEISFTTHSFFPDLSHITQLVLLTNILFGLIGMEMSAVHAEEVKNPQHDYPRALLYSTIIILFSLILASLAIAIVVPQQQLSLVSGLIDAFSIFFHAYHMPQMVPVMAVLIIIGSLSGVSAWIIGPTKGLLVACHDNAVPAILTKVNHKGVPVVLLLIQAVIFTGMCSVFLFMPNINSSYWILSDLTAQLALIVYIMLFLAAVKLRYSHPQVKRSFTIPGGNWGIWVVATVGILTCLGAITLGFFPPAQIQVGSLLRYELFLWLGLIGFSIPPFLISRG